MGLSNYWPFKQDSHAQFEQLIRPYLRPLYNQAFRYTGNKEDAEDLVQDLVLKVFPRLKEMQKIDKLSPWLSKVLYRQFIDQYRHQQRSPVYFMDEEQTFYETHASNAMEPEEVVNTELTRELINVALNKLSENYRMLILLHDVEGYSIAEISGIIDVPEGTIKSGLSRARIKLRKFVRNLQPNSTYSV
ncbi:MAG: RNA polymerase sigma factor [Gammaproteobacteria bacterium]|nr:RNA polymerase sigma factor [Gammaproteobacteria bacterium]